MRTFWWGLGGGFWGDDVGDDDVGELDVICELDGM